MTDFTFAAAADRFGTIEHNGTTIALTQMAYVDSDGPDGAVGYRAAGKDAAGNEYEVTWDTTAAWKAREAAYQADPDNNPPADDESDACDWDSPVEVVMISAS